MQRSNFSILINTTDSYEDCWSPFFKLFKHYWPEYKGKIYLNTETKDFQFEGLDIIPIKNQLVEATWSACLKYALNFIEEDLILYLHEDYFINNFVDAKAVEFYVTEMIENNIDCIHLTPFASNGPFEESEYPGLSKFSKSAAYKISTQASLWRKTVLNKYLRKHENAWQFEVFGTKRAWRHNEEIYIYDFNKDKKQIIPYTPTGIVKGKWNKDAVLELFLKNDININFSIRGFYDHSEYKYSKKAFTFKKVISRIKSAF